MINNKILILENMKRWDLITSDQWIEATIECIVVSKKKITDIRKELMESFLKYRDELLHGNQGIGCFDKKCNVCYPYRYRKSSNK